MASVISRFETLSSTGKFLFYGSSLMVEEFPPVRMPDGSYKKAIPPTLPYRSDCCVTSEFEQLLDEPLVRATRFMPVTALHRALCQPAIHSELSPGQRRYDFNPDTGQPRMTAQLYDKVRLGGFMSFVHLIEFRSPPFTQCPSELDEWRSPDPAEVIDTYVVGGEDLTYEVEIYEPVSSI